MASVSDIARVRRNVNESTADTYSNDDIGALIDSLGVAGATAAIWREKAAKFAGLVNVSESGSSHSYSDLHRAALAMATSWDKLDEKEDIPVTTASFVQVKKIERS